MSDLFQKIMDKETWQFINTFAPWLSAIGTISAVIVSLYFSTKSRRIDLKVDAVLNTIVPQGMPNRDYVTISVVNMGHRAATITNIGWRIGFFRKRHFVQVPGVLGGQIQKTSRKISNSDHSLYESP